MAIGEGHTFGIALPERVAVVNLETMLCPDRYAAVGRIESVNAFTNKKHKKNEGQLLAAYVLLLPMAPRMSLLKVLLRTCLKSWLKLMKSSSPSLTFIVVPGLFGWGKVGVLVLGSCLSHCKKACYRCVTQEVTARPCHAP